MTKRLLIYLAAATGYIGIGLLLGFALSDRARTSLLWFGGVLLLCGVLLVGMVISRRTTAKPTSPDTPPIDPPSQL